MMQKLNYQSHKYIDVIKRFIKNPRWSLKFFFQLYLIRKSRIFDGEYYNSQFKDGYKIKRSLFHYIYYSNYITADPSPYFNTEYYLSQRSFIKKIITDFDISPLFHYLKHGYKDKLNPYEGFNTWSYLKEHHDVYLSGMHPLCHYISFGKEEGRSPDSDFPVIETQNWLWNKNRLTRLINTFFKEKNVESVNYMKWRKKYNVSKREIQKQRSFNFKNSPLISIIVPVYNPKIRFIQDAVKSVIDQTYSNWELCISDCSTDVKVSKLLKRFSEKDPRIRYSFSVERMHISGNSNKALKLANGKFIGLLDHDDLLTCDALFEVVKYIEKNVEIDILYSDEDKISGDSKKYFSPFFKPDWSPDTFMSHNYTCHFTVYRKELLDRTGGFRIGFEGSQDYDLMLRASELTERIGHIPKVLYHWRSHEDSAAGKVDAKEYAFKAAKKAKEEALIRRNKQGTLKHCEEVPGQYYVDYEVIGNPSVTIIIPTHDKKGLLEKCINSIRDKTSYKNYEIIIVDNNSKIEETKDYLNLISNQTDIRVFEYHKQFNYSEINNFAVENTDTDYLLFLNNDIEVLTENWLKKLLGHAQQEHVGAVGAQLLFPESLNIQHCGVLNLPGGPAHAFSNFSSNSVYYFGRNAMDNNWIAVTGACLMVNKDKFNEVNGFDNSLSVSYNDVDLCMKLVKKGYFNLCRNSVKLLHYESVSRGNDLVDKKKLVRLEKELKILNKKHSCFYNKDPFYNSNLTKYKIDFDLNLYSEKI